MSHVHAWHLINPALRRYRCDCGVIGYAPARRNVIVPYKCQKELAGRRHCAADAVVAGHNRTQPRCGEHSA